MEEGLNYWPLFLVFVIAWLVPMVLSWLEVTKVPSVIVEIVAGVLIGPSVLNWVGKEPYLDFLAYTGFLFLIFLSGLETDIRKIIASLPKGRIKQIDLISNSFLVAVIIYLGSLLLSFPVALSISFFYPVDIFFFTVLFPSVALSIVVPILKNDGQLGRRFGQIILMEGAISTIMTIILISIYSGVLQNGFRFELLLFLVIFVAFFAAYKVGKILVRISVFKKILYTLEHAASQIRIRGSIAVLLFFVVIAALIETELVLGAFFAGALLSIFLLKERSALHFKLDGMGYGFFIPIFFIMVGVNLDLSVLKDLGNSLSFVLVLLLGFYLSQVLPTFIMTKVFGVKRAASAGVLLTSRLGLTIAAAQIGLSLSIISPSTNTAIVITAIITSVVSPMLYKYLHHDGKRKYRLYIVGGNKIVGLLGDRMKMHKVDYLIIATNSKSHKLFESRGLETLHAEFIGSQLYQELGIMPYQPVVLLNDLDSNNTEMVRRFKEDLKHDNIITLANKNLHAEANDPGIKLVDRQLSLVDQLEMAIVRPDVFHSLAENFGALSIEEIKMTNPGSDRKRVRDFAFHPSGSLIILRRNKEIFIPHGDTHLLLGDVITVIGTGKALQDFRQKFMD